MNAHARSTSKSLPALLSFPLVLVALTSLALAQGESGSGTSWRGQTLFHPNSGTTTYLIDNEGDVLHTWVGTNNGGSVYLLDDGTLVRSVYGQGGGGPGVQFVSWDGTVNWDFRYSGPTHQHHHDVEMLPNGNILMIAREFLTTNDALAAGRNPAYLTGTTFQPETIIEVQPTGPTSGMIVWEWRVWDHLIQDFDPAQSNYGVVADHPELLDINFPPQIAGGGDWIHANAIAYNADLDQIILNSRHLDEFWIIDHSTTTAQAAGHTGGTNGRGGDFLYRWGNPQSYRAGTNADKQLFGQHNTQWIAPGLPGEGNILIYNNGNGRPAGNFSTVDEIVSPVDAFGHYTHVQGTAYGPTGLVWSYQAANPATFYSNAISGAQRLPNGNTLVCSGVQAWFFEVTDSMEIVWEYNNPFPAGGNQAVFRANRYRLCLEPKNYCATAANSMGAGAQMNWSGTASLSTNDLVLSASGAAASVPGLFFFGDGQVQLPFGDGSRCVGGNLRRLPVILTDGTGQAAIAIDLADPMLSTTVIQAGETWNFQFWFRDSAFGGSGFNLSDGLEVTFCD